MEKKTKIACVTGASGMVGSRIVAMLLKRKFLVRALSRQRRSGPPGVEYYRGDLENQADLDAFAAGAHCIFHCAAELQNEARMQAVNVTGSARLLSAVQSKSVEFICFISSAGVVGATEDKLIDELSSCSPRNCYEKSKYAAEQLFLSSQKGLRTIILRPTNIVADHRPGILSPITRPTFKNRLKLRLIGGELAHIVHADNVAAAAGHLMGTAPDKPACYFVSCDHMPASRLTDMDARYRQIASGIDGPRPRCSFSLPIGVPYLLRKMIGRGGNRGDIRYSSKKLLSTGFRFPVDITEAVRRLAAVSQDQAR